MCKNHDISHLEFVQRFNLNKIDTKNSVPEWLWQNGTRPVYVKTSKKLAAEEAEKKVVLVSNGSLEVDALVTDSDFLEPKEKKNYRKRSYSQNHLET